MNSHSSFFTQLMVEQAHMCERHGDTIFVTCLNNIVVTDRTTSLCDIFYATLVSTLDVVTEWEEGITTQANTCVLCNPCFLLLTCQRLRLLSEELLPNTILDRKSTRLNSSHL